MTMTKEVTYGAAGERPELGEGKEAERATTSNRNIECPAEEPTDGQGVDATANAAGCGDGRMVRDSAGERPAPEAPRRCIRRGCGHPESAHAPAGCSLCPPDQRCLVFIELYDPRPTDAKPARPVRVGDRVRSRSWNKMEWPDGHEVTFVTPKGFGRTRDNCIDVRRADFARWCHADGAAIAGVDLEQRPQRESGAPRSWSIGDSVLIARPTHDMWKDAPAVVKRVDVPSEVGPLVEVRLRGERFNHVLVLVRAAALDPAPCSECDGSGISTETRGFAVVQSPCPSCTQPSRGFSAGDEVDIIDGVHNGQSGRIREAGEVSETGVQMWHVDGTGTRPYLVREDFLAPRRHGTSEAEPNPCDVPCDICGTTEPRGLVQELKSVGRCYSVYECTRRALARQCTKEATTRSNKKETDNERIEGSDAEDGQGARALGQSRPEHDPAQRGCVEGDCRSQRDHRSSPQGAVTERADGSCGPSAHRQCPNDASPDQLARARHIIRKAFDKTTAAEMQEALDAAQLEIERIAGPRTEPPSPSSYAVGAAVDLRVTEDSEQVYQHDHGRIVEVGSTTDYGRPVYLVEVNGRERKWLHDGWLRPRRESPLSPEDWKDIANGRDDEEEPRLHMAASNRLRDLEHLYDKLSKVERVDHLGYLEDLAGLTRDLAEVVKRLAWASKPSPSSPKTTDRE